MSRGCLIALVISMAGTACAQEANGLPGAVMAFDQACLQVRGDRVALAAVANAQGWASAERRSPPERGWQVGYWTETRALVRLTGYPATADGLTPAQVICAVDRIEARPGWEQKVSALTVDGAPLGEPSQPDLSTYQIRPDMELKVWDLADGSRIHASYIPTRSYLELSINYPTGR